MDAGEEHPALLTDPAKGVEALLAALSPWQETAEMQKYEKFEKALHKVTQKNDESFLSYANRLQVAFQELGEQATVKYLLVEDRKRVIAMTDGTLDQTKIDKAIRTLSTKVLVGNDSIKRKVYPANFVEEEGEDMATHVSEHEEIDEEAGLALLAEEGDKQALEEQTIVWCRPIRTWPWHSRPTRRRGRRSRRGPVEEPWLLATQGKWEGGQSLAERIPASTCRKGRLFGGD